MIILTTSTSFYGINQVYVRQKLPHRNILYESQSLETSWKKRGNNFGKKIQCIHYRHSLWWESK